MKQKKIDYEGVAKKILLEDMKRFKEIEYHEIKSTCNSRCDTQLEDDGLVYCFTHGKLWDLELDDEAGEL